MLAEHRETGLDDWLTQAEHCGIKELKSFAASASVAIMLPCAPPSLPTGATDRWKRRLNCLKLQKRLMFGRANFDLLRLHVLRRM
jgi:transposase